MSSYYPNFSYMGFNSLKDKNLIVVHFDNGDNGETETFLGMDSVYTETVYGTHRHDYGAKYNDVAKPKISVMKRSGTDFTVAEVRDFLRWTTGVRKVSYLDMMEGDTVKFSFLGRVINVLQHKMDARTVGFTIEFESTNPWAWSPQQTVKCSFGQDLSVDSNGILDNTGHFLSVSSNGVLTDGTSSSFGITDDGVMFLNNYAQFEINNLTDDLYSYVYLDTTFKNGTTRNLTIKNSTLYSESDHSDGVTEITGLAVNEIIKLTMEQFIISDVPYKVFGNDFNFIWPKLLPGVNQFIIEGDGTGILEFSYRYPIKIGDCSIDTDVHDNGFDCGDCYYGDEESGTTISGSVEWSNITNKPTTIGGYGITDAYTTIDVDNIINNIDVNIDEDELNAMLDDVLK